MDFIDGSSFQKRETQNVASENDKQDFVGIRLYDKNEAFLYRLTVEGNTKAQSIESNFGITSMNELTFLEYDPEKGWWRFRLKELSYNVDKYDDPLILQIVEMSNKVSEIYQELDFWVDSFGELKVINNRAQIYGRWEKVREYLSYRHPLTSYEVIMAKEREMANKELELQNIRFIHFIHCYFFQFGRFNLQERFNVIDMDRFGSGVALMVSVNGTRREREGKIHRHFKGDVVYDGDVVRIMGKAIKEDYAEVIYQTRSDYHSDGLIIEEANFSFLENIGKTYSMYSNLHLVLEKNGR